MESLFDLLQEPEPEPSRLSDRELVVEQIKRDTDTLRDPSSDFSCLDREFYEKRIRLFKELL